MRCWILEMRGGLVSARSAQAPFSPLVSSWLLRRCPHCCWWCCCFETKLKTGEEKRKQRKRKSCGSSSCSRVDRDPYPQVDSSSYPLEDPCSCSCSCPFPLTFPLPLACSCSFPWASSCSCSSTLEARGHCKEMMAMMTKQKRDP